MQEFITTPTQQAVQLVLDRHKEALIDLELMEVTSPREQPILKNMTTVLVSVT